MRVHHLTVLVIVLLIGAFIGGMWPSLNLMGALYSRATS